MSALFSGPAHVCLGFDIERGELPTQKHRNRYVAVRESGQRGTMNIGVD
jgi:hypothetical protein